MSVLLKMAAMVVPSGMPKPGDRFTHAQAQRGRDGDRVAAAHGGACEGASDVAADTKRQGIRARGRHGKRDFDRVIIENARDSRTDRNTIAAHQLSDGEAKCVGHHDAGAARDDGILVAAEDRATRIGQVRRRVRTAVALAVRVNCVALTMVLIVAPAGMPVPDTDWPRVRPTVLATVIVALPWVIVDAMTPFCGVTDPKVRSEVELRVAPWLVVKVVALLIG